MAYKFAGSRIEIQRPLPADDLRRTFEMAVCQIHEADVASKRPAYRTPIVQRGISQAYAEKRALSDAAQALALLWKV
jgi:hypothetical protein